MIVINIAISNEVVGMGKLYAERGKQGLEAEVPLYRMTISGPEGQIRELAVTRDTSRIFGGECGSEAPASLEAFAGRIREDGELGFRVELFEPKLVKEFGPSALKGTGDAVRTHIQIHQGPGRSEGCFLLQGDEAGREEFKKVITEFREAEEVKGVKSEIRIEVQERSASESKPQTTCQTTSAER